VTFPSDSDAVSAVERRFTGRLAAYLDEQGTDADREAVMPEPPWPDLNDDMLAFLLARYHEICETSSDHGAAVWLAVHAWFEGGLAERTRQRREASG
jgi:hypothetical protein